MADQPAGAGNVLTRRYGPAPGYVYLAAAAAAGYVIIRHRAAAAGTADTSTDETLDDAGGGDTDTSTDAGVDNSDDAGNDWATPYDMSGQVYTTLAGTEAQLQKDTTKLANQKQRITKLKGQVAPKTRVITVGANDETKTKIASRYHTTVAEIEKLNPSLKPLPGKKGHAPHLKPGTRVLVPAQEKKK